MKLPRLLRLLRPETPRPGPARAAARTHVGRVRSINEDRLLDRADHGLWAVADGMGGHSAGAAAAMIAIDALDTLASGGKPIGEATVREAIARANRAIYAGEGSARGMAPTTSGTTIVVASIDCVGVTICWAGDSRAYRIRDGVAERLTRDHSLVQELVDSGAIAQESAERHPRANVVTRALGVAPTVKVDSVHVSLEAGDRILLCSDGVSRSLNPRDFTMPAGEIDDFADRLLRNAVQRDGSDNATLVLIERGTLPR